MCACAGKEEEEEEKTNDVRSKEEGKGKRRGRARNQSWRKRKRKREENEEDGSDTDMRKRREKIGGETRRRENEGWKFVSPNSEKQVYSQVMIIDDHHFVAFASEHAKAIKFFEGVYRENLKSSVHCVFLLVQKSPPAQGDLHERMTLFGSTSTLDFSSPQLLFFLFFLTVAV